MAQPVRVPTNRFLIPVRDRRWPRVLTTVLLAATLLLAALLLVGWPRLKSTSVHYEITRLRAEVQLLELEQRLLALELERERNPDRLAEQASGLGLAPPSAAHIRAEVGP
jgi:hypothetical protein